MSDDEATQYVNEFLQGDARRLHSLVAANPLAATRCFHWTVRLVIRTLFNCEDGPGTAADGIPAHAESGVFGHVRASWCGGTTDEKGVARAYAGSTFGL